MEEITMAKASLPWEWIVEKLVDFREVGTPLLKAMISHIPDINNSSCSTLQERIALRYLEEILFVGKIEAHAIPVMKVFVDSSLSNSTAAEDAEDLLLRICTEVVFGHIREADENGERDWEGFEDDLKRIFAEDSLSPSFVGRRNELLEILNDKTTYISTLEKYPVEVLKSDLFHFVRDKKACLYKTVLDQVVCDVSNGEYYTGSSFVHKHEECINNGGRKRLYRETTLECEHSGSEGHKRLKHVGNDGSSSNVKKIKECMIIGHTDSKNSFHKEKYLDSRTENSNKDIRESTANDSPDMRCRQEVNCNRDEEILQLSNDTQLSHGHCHEITDDDAQGLEGQVSEPEENNLDAKSRKEDHLLLEAEDLPELDHILFGNGCPGQSCFKCRKGGALSYCDECSTAGHEKCLQPDSSITLGENAGCPVCSYKRALAAYKKAKKEALESKKILLAFIDNKEVQHNGQKSQERCRSEKQIFPNTENTSNDHSSNPSASNLHSNRKEIPLQTRNSETLHKNQMLNETENDQPFMQHAYGGRHDRDCKANDAENSNYSLRQRKSPTSMRGNCRLPGARRVKLTWTKAEEEILKEGVQKFASIDNNVMPWKLILEHGIGIFHKSRLPVDLKDKWRNMKKGSS